MRANLLVSSFLLLMLGSTSVAEVPPESRALIDSLTSITGAYVAEEGVYKLIVPREAATVILDDETLSPNLRMNSWASFMSATHYPALMTGQFLLLDDEVDSIVDAVLASDLQVTGLAALTLFDGPRLYTLDVFATGSYRSLATAFRRALDEIRQTRAEHIRSRVRFALPSVPKPSSIDATSLNGALSMRGTSVDGVYAASIGRRALINGETVGREMGMSTWVSISGTNQQALAHGEIVAATEEIKPVLLALRFRRLHIVSVRNHTANEHSQMIFVRFWGAGTAIELAKAFRYCLDVQTGAVSPPQRGKA